MSDKVSARTTVTVGAYTFDTTDDAEPVPGVAQVMDGLELSTQLEGPWPWQETETATFAVWAPAAADVVGIAKGDAVTIDYATPRAGGFTQASFAGIVTDAVLRNRADGVAMELVAVDRVRGELTEEIGDDPWPQETVQARVERIFALLGLPFLVDFELPLIGGGILDLDPTAPGAATECKARDVDRQPALGLLTGLLNSWAWDWSADLVGVFGLPLPADSPSAGMGRFVIQPPTIDEFWTIRPRLSAIMPPSAGVGVKLPGVFGPTPDVGGYGVTYPVTGADRAESLIPAGRVDLASAYTQLPGQRPNRVTVGYTAGGAGLSVTESNGQTPASRFTLETELTAAAAARRAAQLYLPDPGMDEWYAEGFLWRWGADTDAHGWPMPGVGDLLTVAPIDTRHTPPDPGGGAGKPFYGGVLTGRRVQLVNARPLVDLTLTPTLRPQLDWAVGGAGLTWDSLPAGVTWDDLNSRDTWNDYRGLRA